MLDTKSMDTFQSSIKIKGLHFFPPVITTKRRIELQRYKQQAVKLEKRLQRCRDLRRNLEELLLLHPPTDQSSESDSIVDRGCCIRKELGCNLFSAPRHRPILSHDIIDITEYGKDGIKIINKTQTNVENIETINNVHKIANTNLNQDGTIQLTPTDNSHKDKLELVESNLNKFQSIIEPSSNFSNPTSPNELNEGNFPPPRLIRSNSYILENPSPILLAHLDKFCQNGQNDDPLFEQSEFNNKNLSSSERNYIPFGKSELNDIHTVYNSNNENIGPELAKNDTNNDDSSKIEVIQTDISVQHITVDYNKNECEEIDMQKSSLELVDPNCQLIEVLKSIPEDYSKKILDLIEKHQLEQSSDIHLTDSYENYNQSTQNDTNSSLKCDHLSTNQDELIWSNTICEPNLQNEKSNNDSDKMSLSPSQSIYYTLSSTGTVLPTSPSIHIIDLESEDFKSEMSKNIVNNGNIKNFADTVHEQQLENCRRRLSFRQEKFKHLGAEIKTSKQETAASIIGAHVKGYLTRRLLKTERVQSLINTIKDALICALQLHSADNIDESDVELHRRLINQVTAACYTFHDIFFSLSIPEQMSIIQTDRRRMLEKAKRPASAPTPHQNRSAIKLKPRPLHSQSLTKV